MADSKSPRRPRDPNELAKFVVDMATNANGVRVVTDDGRDAAAVALGRLGGLKGGRVRAERLSPERRAEIAAHAAAARWGKNDG